MTIREFKDNNRKIAELQSKVSRLEDSVYRITPTLDDTSSSGSTPDRVGLSVSEITDLNAEIRRLEIEQANAINRLSLDVFEENCIYFFLQRHYSWAKIAVMFGTTEGSLKMSCGKYSW